MPEIPHRTPEEHRAIKLAWERANRERIYAQQKVWRDANRAEIRARHAAMRAANRERMRADHKRYYERHRDEIRPRSNAMTARWRAANPDKVREGSVKQRLRRIEAIQACAHLACRAVGPIAVAWMANPHRCYLCGVSVRLAASIDDPSKCEMDHVLPISRGGLHCADNLRPSCRACNRRKHAKTPEELRWMAA